MENNGDSDSDLQNSLRWQSDIDQRFNRIRIINTAVDNPKTDFGLLNELASGGLVNNGLRCKVWPKLLGIEKSDYDEDHIALIKKHREWDQVERDVERSLFKLIGADNKNLKEKRKELSNIINAILSTNPGLSYFQGYHDIASILLLVCGEKQGYVLLKKLSLYHIRDYLNESLDVVMQLLQQIFPLLRIIDKEVFDFIRSTNLEPYFALSWVLTWFSHSIDDLMIVARLFDFFLSSHPYAVVYMSVAVVIYRRKELLKCNREYSAVHTFLTKLPPDIPFETLIEMTTKYLTQYPPGCEKMKFEIKNSKMPQYPFNWVVVTKNQKPVKRTWIYVSVAVVVLSVVVYYYYY